MSKKWEDLCALPPLDIQPVSNPEVHGMLTDIDKQINALLEMKATIVRCMANPMWIVKGELNPNE